MKAMLMIQYKNRRMALVAVDAIVRVDLKGFEGGLQIYLAGRKKPIKPFGIYDELKGESAIPANQKFLEESVC